LIRVTRPFSPYKYLKIMICGCLPSYTPEKPGCLPSYTPEKPVGGKFLA
jgi:hypothetical protein